MGPLMGKPLQKLIPLSRPLNAISPQRELRMKYEVVEPILTYRQASDLVGSTPCYGLGNTYGPSHGLGNTYGPIGPITMNLCIVDLLQRPT